MKGEHRNERLNRTDPADVDIFGNREQHVSGITDREKAA